MPSRSRGHTCEVGAWETPTSDIGYRTRPTRGYLLASTFPEAWPILQGQFQVYCQKGTSMENRETAPSTREPVATLPPLAEISSMRYEELHRVVSRIRSNTNWTTPQYLMGSGGNTKYAEKRHVPIVEPSR